MSDAKKALSEIQPRPLGEAQKLVKLKRAIKAAIEDAIANDDLDAHTVQQAIYEVNGVPHLHDAHVVRVGFRPANYDEPAEGAVLMVTVQANHEQRSVEGVVSESDLDFLGKAGERYLGAQRRARQAKADS
jgi:hypothetical protein